MEFPLKLYEVETARGMCSAVATGWRINEHGDLVFYSAHEQAHVMAFAKGLWVSVRTSKVIDDPFEAEQVMTA